MHGTFEVAIKMSDIRVLDGYDQTLKRILKRKCFSDNDNNNKK